MFWSESRQLARRRSKPRLAGQRAINNRTDQALARRDEVGMARCSSCGGLRLRDLLARHKQTCTHCNHGAPPPLTH
jgi:hypothetical protein